MALVPFGKMPAFVAFPGDLILFAYLLGLMGFSTVIGALDTGSSFEGMGGSREVQFSALAEPALFLALVAVARRTGSISLSGMFDKISVDVWQTAGLSLALVAAALLVVLLCENGRIPGADPNTHPALTIINPLMVHIHASPHFPFI